MYVGLEVEIIKRGRQVLAGTSDSLRTILVGNRVSNDITKLLYID